MDKIYKMLEMLYEELEVYIVPHDNIHSKVGKTYVTYKILTHDIKDLEQEQEQVVMEDDKVYRELYKQFQGSISFNVVSDDDSKAFSLAQKLHDCLHYILKDEIYTDLDIVILNVTPLTDVTVRLTDAYSYRYNVDMTFRASRIIRRDVGRIEKAEIKTEVDK